jgi:hypothetical protein
MENRRLARGTKVFAISEFSGGVIIVFRGASPSVPKNVQSDLIFGCIPRPPGPQDGHPIRPSPSIRSRKETMSSGYIDLLSRQITGRREHTLPPPRPPAWSQREGRDFVGIGRRTEPYLARSPISPGRKVPLLIRSNSLTHPLVTEEGRQEFRDDLLAAVRAVCPRP